MKQFFVIFDPVDQTYYETGGGSGIWTADIYRARLYSKLSHAKARRTTSTEVSAYLREAKQWRRSTIDPVEVTIIPK